MWQVVSVAGSRHSVSVGVAGSRHPVSVSVAGSRHSVSVSVAGSRHPVSVSVAVVADYVSPPRPQQDEADGEGDLSCGPRVR